MHIATALTRIPVGKEKVSMSFSTSIRSGTPLINEWARSGRCQYQSGVLISGGTQELFLGEIKEVSSFQGPGVHRGVPLYLKSPKPSLTLQHPFCISLLPLYSLEESTFKSLEMPTANKSTVSRPRSKSRHQPYSGRPRPLAPPTRHTTNVWECSFEHRASFG